MPEEGEMFLEEYEGYRIFKKPNGTYAVRDPIGVEIRTGIRDIYTAEGTISRDIKREYDSVLPFDFGHQYSDYGRRRGGSGIPGLGKIPSLVEAYDVAAVPPSTRRSGYETVYTPSRGRAEGPRPSIPREAFATIGVVPKDDAARSRDEVTRKYREEMKKVHPDYTGLAPTDAESRRSIDLNTAMDKIRGYWRAMDEWRLGR